MNKFALALPILTVLAGTGLFVAENAAGTALEDQLTERISAIAPGAKVASTDVRGRPYLASWSKGEVSTAYLHLTPTKGVVKSTVIVQNLDLDTGRAGHVRTVVWLPYRESSTKPVLSRDGAYTDSARVKGSVVRFSATLEGQRVVPSARGGRAPAPVRLRLPAGSARVDGVSAMEDGLAVEVVSSGVTTTTPRIGSR